MNKRIPIIVVLLMMCIAIWLLLTPTKPVRHLLERLNNLGYDVQLRARVFAEKVSVDNPVAIIDIDDKSIRAEGRWPWPRSRLALLIDKLHDQGAAVVAFDIFFPEKQKNITETVIEVLGKKNLLNSSVQSVLKANSSLFDEDAVFIKSIAANQTVLSYSFLPRNETQNELPPPMLTLTPQESEELQITTEPGYISNIESIQQASKGGGFINIFPDDDGIVRRAPLLIEHKGGIYPALALEAVMIYLDKTVKLIKPYYLNKQRLEGVQLGNYRIPTDSKGFVYIPFIGRSYTFPYYSAIDILEGRIPPETLLGKIVFIGTSATGLGDLQPTSIQNPFPGVEIQASLVNGILHQEFSYRPAWTIGANVLLTILFGLLAAFLFPYLGPRILAIMIILVPIIALYLNNIIWNYTGLILSFLMPVSLLLFNAIFNLLYGYVFETRRREQLKEMFGQYVPETHINEMMKAKGKFSLHGENREMSVMFADIRNFTTISETMPAADLVDMLNAYFTPMTEIIHKYVGTVDKYIGDLIMAFWGAPLHDTEHAFHAIQAALQMRSQLDQLRHMQGTKKWPEIVMGIGINSGKMSVGDMGSQFRRNYTVLGDSVNLASRVESLTKYYEVDILVTDSTMKDQTKFAFRKLDRVRVKGKSETIDLYEVIGFLSQMTPQVTQELETYHKTLELYRNQHWDQAEMAMKKLHEAHPKTKIYSIYLERIAQFKVTPPPADWDGTYVRSEK